MRFKRAWFRALVRRRIAVILLLVLQVLFICYVISSETVVAEIIRVLLRVASGFIALHVFCQKDKGAYKVAWISLTLLFPLFGSVFYLLCYFQSSTRRFRTAIAQIQQDIKSLYHLPKPVSGEAAQADLIPYLTQKQYLQDYAGFPAYDQTEVQYYSPGELFWAPFLGELQKAQSYIFMEYFILDSGLLWDSILEILIEKASKGVEVRIIYDDIGCFLILPSNFAKQLEQHGIKCVAFNSFRPFLSTSQNNRDHRKITSIDGKVAFTGGLILADEYVNLYEKHGYWKDCAVKVEGKAAWSLTLMFLEMWELCCRTHECFADFYPADGYPQRRDACGYVQPYADSPMDDENVCEHVYMQILNQAKDYVYITTPYLIVDGSMVSALCLAAKSGVDVRIITPQVWDKALIHMTTRSYYRELMQGGVKIYEYTDGFIHSKTFVSDDRQEETMTAKLVEKLRIIVFPILGVVLILCSGHVTRILPYLLGGAMVLTAVLWGINDYKTRKLVQDHSDGLTSCIVLLIMGVAFILQGSNALGAIGTTWAMIGIGKASKSLKQAICRLYQKQHFAIPAIEFLLRMTLALILLFHPFEKFSTHIIILGLELIAVSIRLPQSLPFGNNSKNINIL